jgi:hypothetical protein
MKHIKEIVNRRTQERCSFYNDQTDTDELGNPTGKGRLQCDIYSAVGAFLGTFPEDGNGIGDTLADDAAFGATFTRNPTSMIDVRFLSANTVYSYRSWDDGRTWSVAGQQPEGAGSAAAFASPAALSFQLRLAAWMQRQNSNAGNGHHGGE